MSDGTELTDDQVKIACLMDHIGSLEMELSDAKVFLRDARFDGKKWARMELRLRDKLSLAKEQRNVALDLLHWLNDNPDIDRAELLRRIAATRAEVEEIAALRKIR